jgi:hypothetical protein
MPKAKTNRGKFLKLDIIKNKCKDCGKDYEANKMAYEKGEVITPPRCPACQTTHLTNLRVNKTIKDLSLLGNLKARLSDMQRHAVIEAVSAAINTLLDRYSGSTVQASAFDLRKVKV